jgi:hypothetical protein
VHLPEIYPLVKTWGNKSGSKGELRNMTQDRIGKGFTVIFTNGDLPDNPMSLRECMVCGGVFTGDQSWAHSQVPCQPSLGQPLAVIASRGSKSEHKAQTCQ